MMEDQNMKRLFVCAIFIGFGLILFPASTTAQTSSVKVRFRIDEKEQDESRKMGRHKSIVMMFAILRSDNNKYPPVNIYPYT